MVLLENALQYADYRRLRESVGWQNFDQGQACRAIENSLFNVVAVEDGRAVGMGRLIGDGLYDAIVDVVVSPELQERGIGSAIIESLLAHAQKGTPPGGRISVQLIAAEGKEPFYEKLGFRRLPNGNSGSGMRKILHGA